MKKEIKRAVSPGFLEKSLQPESSQKKEAIFYEEFEKSEEGLSLQEIFKRKKGNLLKKLEENKRDKQENQINQDEVQRTTEFKARTKEEILKLRKEMMKKPSFLKKTIKEESLKEEIEQEIEKNPVKIDETELLLQRLALGTKQKVFEFYKENFIFLLFLKVGKKEMKALTSKNYEKLPEVKKKKEVEDKKTEYKKRQEKTKKLEQVFLKNIKNIKKKLYFF